MAFGARLVAHWNISFSARESPATMLRWASESPRKNPSFCPVARRAGVLLDGLRRWTLANSSEALELSKGHRRNPAGVVVLLAPRVAFTNR